MDRKPPPAVKLEPPRFADGRALTIAGLGGRYAVGTEEIGGLWMRFAPHIGHVPGQVGRVTYGVSHNFGDDGHFDYLAGVQVGSASGLPAEFQHVRIAPHLYAVFTHSDPIGAIGATHMAIWSKWMPESKFQPAEPLNFERYDERFDPRTNTGPVEIWVPIKDKK